MLAKVLKLKPGGTMAPGKSITDSGVGPGLVDVGIVVVVGTAVSVAGRLVAGTAVSSAVDAWVAVGSGVLLGGTAVLAVAVGVAAGLVQATAVNKISPSKMV